MARTLAALPEGSRITDYISLGVITKAFPLKQVRSVLIATGKASQRERDLPAHVVVYYAIALGLYMHSSYREVLRCLLEGVQWLLDPGGSAQGGRQLGDLAGAYALGVGAAAPVARRGGQAHCRGRHQGGLVPRPAVG
jgi:hypothetical protein